MSKRISVIIITELVLTLSCRQCYSDNTIHLSESDIDAKLFELKPLPKVHYYWPPSLETMDSRRLYELARITHSLCVADEWATEHQIDNCVYTCARINKTNPVIKVSLGVNFSPFHNKFDKNLPPTDRGPAYLEELKYFEERSSLIKKWIAESNKKYGSDIKITAVTLDCERFVIKTNDELWNEGIRQALDVVHNKSQSMFPEARIEWYGRGIGQSASNQGWSKTNTWTGKEISKSLSCSLYSVPEIERTRETYRRTVKLADEMKVESVTPWVALASGYRRGMEDISDEKFDFNWDYDIIYSFLLGREINLAWYGELSERFAPYNRAKIVVFYPPPFDKRIPNWGKHFIAYVRGATGVKDLNDLGYER